MAGYAKAFDAPAKRLLYRSFVILNPPIARVENHFFAFGRLGAETSTDSKPPRGGPAERRTDATRYDGREKRRLYWLDKASDILDRQ